jgi:hypothetical protein
MPRRCILHIGSGKTGSSSIQEALSLALTNQSNQSFCYPEVGALHNNQLFRLAFCKLEQSPINIRERYNCNEVDFHVWQQSIRDEFYCKTRGQHDVIISSEFLFHSDAEEALKICSFLEECGFSRIQVIGYVRKPSDYFLSVAQQALKSRQNLPDINRRVYNVSKALNTWSNLAITAEFREFSRTRLYNQDVVEDFFASIGLNLDQHVIRGLKRRNESISPEAIQAIQDLHIWLHSRLDCPLPYKHSRKIVGAYLKAIHSTDQANVRSSQPLKEQFEAVVNYIHKDDIRLCANRYGILQSTEIPAAFKLIRSPEFFYELVDNFDYEYYNICHDILVEIMISNNTPYANEFIRRS